MEDALSKRRRSAGQEMPRFIPPSLDDCEAYLQNLQSKSKEELCLIWKKTVGTEPVQEMRRELLEPILAYKLRERIYGALKPAVRAELLRIAASFKTKTKAPASAKDRFQADTRLLREWGGEVHEVTVMPTGYQYRGEVYRSLSQIARTITGTRWSGPAFFGTKEKAAKK